MKQHQPTTLVGHKTTSAEVYRWHRNFFVCTLALPHALRGQSRISVP